MPTKAEIEILKEKKRMGEIISKIETELEQRRKKYEEQKQKIKDLGYTEGGIDSVLHKLIAEHPVLEPLFLREMYWSRVRELEEVKKMIGEVKE